MKLNTESNGYIMWSKRPELNMTLDKLIPQWDCRFCGSTKKIEKCHVVPPAWHGKNHFNNIIRLCRKCHISFDRFVGVIL